MKPPLSQPVSRSTAAASRVRQPRQQQLLTRKNIFDVPILPSPKQQQQEGPRRDKLLTSPLYFSPSLPTPPSISAELPFGFSAFLRSYIPPFFPDTTKDTHAILTKTHQPPAAYMKMPEPERFRYTSAHSLHFGGHRLGRLELPLNHGAPAPAGLGPLPPQEVALLDLGVLPLVQQPAGRGDHVQRHRVGEQEGQRTLFVVSRASKSKSKSKRNRVLGDGWLG